MEALCQDVKYALRVMAKNPGFTAVAVLTLTLGIGANTAIFTVINAVLLRPLPVSAPQELVVLSDPDSHGMQVGSETGERTLYAYYEFEYLRDHNQALSGIFAASSSLIQPEVRIGGSAPSDAAEPFNVSLVSGAYFSVLGVPPAIGRAFQQDVDRVRDANPVAVLSYNCWRQRLASDPGILGRSLRIYQTTFNIIGVMPPGFFGETVGTAPDIWVPLSMQSATSPGRDFLSPRRSVLEKTMWLEVVGRRKPGTSLAQANASLNVTFQQMLQGESGAAPSEKERRAILDQKIVLHEGSRGASTLRARFSEPLVMLMALVGMVLLIACANVANLLLARSAARRKEIAVRLALGARRARLLQQLLTESVLLALAGGATGLLLARWADVLLVRMVSQGPQPIPIGVDPDARILAFTLAVSLLTGILFGLAPAMRATRLELASSLKPATRGGGDAPAGGRVTMGKVLVVTQVAISLTLLVVAGLFVRSFQMLASVNLGYERENLLLFHLDPVPAGYKADAIPHLYREILDRLAAVPGVRGITLSHNGLFTNRESDDPIWVEGYTPKSDAEMQANWDEVGPNYFTTVGIPILTGRDIGPQDNAAAPCVGLINQTFAQKFFPDANPLGKHVRDTYPDNPAEMEIVGVVADAKYNSLKEKTPPRFYVPYFHPIVPAMDGNFELRVAGSSAAVAAMVRDAVKSVDPNLPTIAFRTMGELVDRSMVRERMIMRLSSLFGLVALLLASIGLYGVMAYTVTRRTNEIGIRMALGAARGNVLLMVLRETLTLVVAGVAIGVPLVLAGGSLISSLLFGLTGTDSTTVFFAIAVLLVVAAAAGYFPAHRASRLDPILALRYE